ncbi:uncharacterized protein PFL1_03764 [Pseudozyma flocculosa PF-1]|uniref:Related to Engulfment and cell motility gene 1 protein n=2 Tax=Pseudozyma flocculosa TaxID=84751 RepID=A0A5C3EZ01_9BASI|nr:uncharacterized protein PFL1_03764 [Pseudozyma flocculosa PF-1]EPQ28461.1 hypothetical protein PFL1_03764 [Pseudozyma flocculosa PF-1]SPO36379.1 related to Engulfment and cell motility gene 1 protein [Pseudozyma flocculosa]
MYATAAGSAGPSYSGAPSPISPSAAAADSSHRDGPLSSSAATTTSSRPAASVSSTTAGSRINLVTYKHSTIKALIDPSLPVQDVIRQLCANAHLGVQEPPALFALRDDETEELIDDANMARKIEAGANFKLTSSPTIEAVEMVDKLSSQDERVLKMATYTLQRLIREKPFIAEFLARGGLNELLHIIKTHGVGNTLAYALTSCQNLMESSDQGWDVIDGNFIAKVVYILASQERINVCRPATAILQKLVLSGPLDAPTDTAGRVLTEGEAANANSSSGAAATRAYKYGFEPVYREIRAEPTFLQTLVHRLGSADTTLCLYSLSLLNSLIRNVTESLFEDFISEIERLDTPKAVARLMDANRGDELSSSILEYQGNAARIARRRMKTPVTPTDKRHVTALSYVWLQARITDAPADPAPNGLASSSANSRLKWRRLGFASESAAKEFTRVGWLGLDCLESFVRADPDLYAKIIQEQINRPEERRCPFGRASIEVTEILADHWNVESGYTTSTTFKPFLLFFQKVHHLALRFFLRIWNESGAAAGDFSRVSALVRSQVAHSLHDESTKGWYDVERDFLESEYRTVRDRQMKELETEDDFSSRASIRNLRGRLYRESYEFVRQQRIHCLLEGAWFRNPAAGGGRYPGASAGGGAQRRDTIQGMPGGRLQGAGGGMAAASGGSGGGKTWRFYRLSPNKKHLHYCEAMERIPIRGGLDDLPERIDLSLVMDVSLQASGGVHGGHAANGGGGADGAASSLVFSLLRAPDVSLADLQALNQSQYSEWIDGLNMLRGEGGVVSTKETAEYIQILTEIGVKVKLLDLTGEGIDIPTSIPPPQLPTTTEFFFADL